MSGESDEVATRLIEMGFQPDVVKQVVEKSGDNFDLALTYLAPQSDLRQDTPDIAMTQLSSAESQDSRDPASFLERSLSRSHNKFGVLISGDNPEVGAVLDALLSIPAIAQAVLNEGRDYQDDVGFNATWWQGDPIEIPNRPSHSQQVAIELSRLAAFVHAKEGRLQASVRALEALLPSSMFRSVVDFILALSNINPALRPLLITTLEDVPSVPTRERPLIRIDSEDGDSFDYATDEAFWPNGLAALEDHPETADVSKLAQVIAVESSAAIPVVETWYPQRYTVGFRPYMAKYRETKSALRSEQTRLRQKRLKLRSFKGSDVPVLISNTREILAAEPASEDITAALSTLDTLEQSQRDDVETVLQELEAVTTRGSSLPSSMHVLDPEFYSLTNSEPYQDSEPYYLTSLIISDHNYYLRFDNTWYNVAYGRPNESSFDAAREASESAQGYLAIYSSKYALELREPLKIPPSLWKFLQEDLDIFQGDLAADDYSDDSGIEVLPDGSIEVDSDSGYDDLSIPSRS